MATSITHDFSTANLITFLYSIDTRSELFFGLGGRNLVYNNGEPLITKAYSEITDFWDTLLGVKRIDKRFIQPVVKKIIWQTGIEYTPFVSSDVNSYTADFYAINSSNEVFLCNTSSGLSTEEPQAATSNTTLSDGYVWDYLYKANDFTLSNVHKKWFPVNFNDYIDRNDASFDKESIYKLKSRVLSIKCEISDPFISNEFTEGAFKKLGLLYNPKLNNGNNVINNYEDINQLLPYAGATILIENTDNGEILNAQTTNIYILLRF